MTSPSLCLLILSVLYKSSSSYDLELDARLKLQWQVNAAKSQVEFELLFETKHRPQDWIAFGFSHNEELKHADFCAFWVDWKQRLHLQDTHTENDTLLILDAQDDCADFQARQLAKGVILSFTRKFDTCDNNDYIIEDGTTHIVWSYGQGPLFSLNHLDIGDTATSKSGFARTRLLKVDVPKGFPEDSQLLDIRHSMQLPSDDTTYWCSVHKLPTKLKKKHHAIQYEPIATPGNEHLLHHMEVFHCIPNDEKDIEFPLWSGPCGSDEAPEKLKQCKKVLAAWAIGAQAFTYPPEAGLEIGGSAFQSLYVMLEVHFNNQGMESGVKDNSGMRFVLTQKLRPYDAGIMELGLVYTDKMAIPPGQERFVLHGYCLPQCTAVGFPSSGIHIFGSQLHTHGTGIQVETRHFRGHQELKEINRDPHYSTHFQEIRPLHDISKVLPGDELVTSCYYQTLNKDKAVVGGFT